MFIKGRKLFRIGDIKMQQPYYPRPPQEAPQQVPSQYPPQYQPKPPVELGRIFSEKLIAVFVIVSMILMFVGVVICNASAVTKVIPTADDIEGAAVAYKAGMIVLNIGTLLLAMILLLGGILNKDIHTHARLGMLISAGITLAWRFMAIWGQ